MSSMVVAFSINFLRQSSAMFSACSHPSVDFCGLPDCPNAFKWSMYVTPINQNDIQAYIMFGVYVKYCSDRTITNTDKLRQHDVLVAS